ncbi:type II secretion system major pseudopilin GspG [Sphingomonas canadensis]|uniref:type II secretion system major pseudopilin GspG n=1 Tax=Sphingomonas canadensis TaxID=1219257 RepID=UPI0029F4E6D0|nr:type II secretion system major pseudopilin GspG [Sphingomonas canadensis]
MTLRVHKSKRHGHGEAGLTLIEMLIVLVIIGIVATLVVVNVIDRPDEARVTATKSDIKTLRTALSMYRLDNGDYPTAEQGLNALYAAPTPAPPAWRAYVQDAPKDKWGRDYVYARQGGGYTITSLGRDGKPGGEGSDADIVEQGQ